MKIEITSKNQLSFFPSVVFKGKIDNDSFIDNLKKTIENLKEKKEGIFPYGGDVQFETNDNLHEKKEFKELCDLIIESSNQILNAHKLIRNSHYITNMWATSTNKNFSHVLHTHPNCYLSGLIYINTPENCGKLVFRDPRPQTTVMQYNYLEYNEHNSNREYINPEKGLILFWPHWLEHMVEKHNEKYTGEENRMMVAFNIMVKTDINLKTAQLRI